MRPTGALHIGYYVVALENWIKLQDEYDRYFLIADYQALSDRVHEIEKIREFVKEVVIDWLSVGLDLYKSTFVIQEYVSDAHDKEELENLKVKYVKGGIGDVIVKKILIRELNLFWILLGRKENII